MGLRKRRKPISAKSIAEDLSIDDMFKYINREFVSQDSNPVEYVLGICKDVIHCGGKVFLLYDARESLDPDHEDWSWGEELPPFYGRTIREAVSKCYVSLKQEELKNK